MSGSHTSALLEVRNVSVEFLIGRPGLFQGSAALRAVDQVSLTVAAGETLGVVGESGCGKSTLGRAMLHLIPPTEGEVAFEGKILGQLSTAALRELRRRLQIVFQDPLAALDPRMTVGEIVGEPIRTFEPSLGGRERRARVEGMLDAVGLNPAWINRYPHEFSGGQCQRIGIARAVVSNPAMVVCDEPVSALDVSIQAQIINLLIELRGRLGLSLVFISHNLAVVRLISHRVAVLYLGRLVELAEADAIFEQPRHPYTRALIAAVPIPDPEVERGRAHVRVKGEPPSPLNPPSGCAFRTRCPHAIAQCAAERPPLVTDDRGGLVACHRWRELASYATGAATLEVHG